MAILVTTTLVDCDGTGNANEFRVKVKHEADFPTGGTDPVTGLPSTVHVAHERVLVITATTAVMFKNAVKTDGNTWKAQMISDLGVKPTKIAGGVNIGDTFTY